QRSGQVHGSGPREAVPGPACPTPGCGLQSLQQQQRVRRHFGRKFMKLDNKVAVVTGGASGFGRAICELYAREGAKVVVADINGQGAREVANGIGKAAVHVATDVSKRADVDAMVGEAVKAFGGVDIMVNNAGYTHKNQ